MSKYSYIEKMKYDIKHNCNICDKETYTLYKVKLHKDSNKELIACFYVCNKCYNFIKKGAFNE